MNISQLINVFEKDKYLTIVFEESDNGGIQTCERLVWLVTSGVMRTATVEDISSSIAALILRNAFPE